MSQPLPPADDAPTAGAARRARAYVAALLAGVAAIGLALGLFAWRLGPPEGDLVRIAGLSSRAFGWRGEALGFAENRYDRVRLAALLDGAPPGDVLVFGDSFSIMHRGGVSWINTLQARTGLSIRFVRIDSFAAPMRYLTSDAFAARPPRAVLVQSVERGLVVRAAGVARDCPAPPPGPSSALPPDALSPEDPPRRAFSRETAFESFDALMSWGALAARIRLTGPAEPVRVTPLTRADLFTHAAGDRAPILGADVANHLPAALAPLGGPERAAALARCGLVRLAAAAGATPFRLIVAPDKRTIYAPWIAEALPPKALDVFALARAALGPRFVGLRAPLRRAAERGTRDVYLPDDSHWGAAGHRLAGAAAAESLVGAAPR